jgi:hypothetical protein
MTRAAPKPARRRPASRAALWAGTTAGTAAATAALTHGIALPLPGLGPLLTFAMIVALAVAAAEALRRHHKTLARHAARHGSRGAAAAARAARRHGKTITRQLAAWAAPRWQRRARWSPLTWPQHLAQPEAPPQASAPEGPAPDGPDPGPSWSWGRAGIPAGWPASSRAEAEQRAQHASTAGGAYVVTEYPPGGGPGKTIATYMNGKPSQTGGTSTMTGTAPGTRRHRATAPSGVPAEWADVIAATADFQPDSDTELHAWIQAQARGVQAWAEALTEVYDTCVDAIGVDPAPMQALHDTADVAVDAAEAMAGVSRKLAAHYEPVDQFTGDGGLLAKDGRWHTGGPDA